jgi:hypothetical protein
MKSMQIKLIGIRAFALGHRIAPFSIASAATIVIVGAGEEKKGIMRVDMRRHQLLRIMVIGTVLPKFGPKFIGYACMHGYGHGYGYLRGLYSDGYSGASDDPTRLAKPTLN